MYSICKDLSDPNANVTLCQFKQILIKRSYLFFVVAGSVRVPALENGARGWDSAPGTADPGGGNGSGDPNQDQVRSAQA
jgi:hypothetical protein